MIMQDCTAYAPLKGACIAGITVSGKEVLVDGFFYMHGTYRRFGKTEHCWRDTAGFWHPVPRT